MLREAGQVAGFACGGDGVGYGGRFAGGAAGRLGDDFGGSVSRARVTACCCVRS
jgi:hypothetical protein